MDQKYKDAVQLIKVAILQSQYEAAKSANEKQLMLYYGIGKYISLNSRNGFWGQGAIEAISSQLERELPGLKGFSARNLRYMRTFYEEWNMLDSKGTGGLEDMNSNLEPAGAKLELSNWNPSVPKLRDFPIEQFFTIGFSHHRTILSKCKNYDERIFYIIKCGEEKLSREQLIDSINADDYNHQGKLPNNFVQTMTPGMQALKAVSTFKDEYLLDFINVEEIDARDAADVDEKVVENSIMNNVMVELLWSTGNMI